MVTALQSQSAFITAPGVADRPLRVAFYLFVPGGGIGRYTHEMLRHFQHQDDIDAELVCLPGFEWLGEASYHTWPELREIAHPVAWRRRARFLAAQFGNPRRLCRRIRETQVDVVHFSNINHLTFPFWRGMLGRTRVKVASTVHDVRRAKAMISRRYESQQLQAFYRRADALFVHSRAQAEDLLDYASVAEHRVHIVPHGPYDYGPPSAGRVELRRKYHLPQDRQVALFFGNIRDEKNLDRLLRVLPRFRDTLHVVVAGRAASGHRGVGEYRAMAERLGVASAVTFIDRYVADAEIPDLFELCDWAALPYSRQFTSQSGVLNVAAQYRRPVLVSNAPTFAETLEQCDIGVAVDCDDESALAAGVSAIAARLEAGAAFEFDRYAALFGWDENVRRTAAVYRSLVGGAAP